MTAMLSSRRGAVADIRAAYGEVVNSAEGSPTAWAWRRSRFERGCKLAEELVQRIGPLAGRRILDVGAAHGGDTVALYANGACCTGADKFDHGYAALKERIAPGDDRLNFTLFDCTEPWPLPNGAYDVVLSLSVLEMVENRELFFREMLRVLRPGGVAIVYTGTALRMVRCDPLFRLPGLSLLPTPLRRWIAERIFGRRYRFPLSRHTYYTCRSFRKLVRPLGYDVVPAKYLRSPIMQRVARWPLARLWQQWICELAYDFVVIAPRDEVRQAPGYAPWLGSSR